MKNGVNCREALLGNCYQVGNPQPSQLSNRVEGSEAIRPASHVDDEMVHTTKKLVGTCNRLVVGSNPTSGAMDSILSTNSQIVSFASNHYLAVALLVVSILKIVPPNWVGFWKYNDNNPTKGRAPFITPLTFLLTALFDSVIRSFFLPLLATFNLRNMVSLVIFLVVIFDIFFLREISAPVVTLVGIGIVTLYLETLVEKGKSISLFGLIKWERNDSGNSEEPTA